MDTNSQSLHRAILDAAADTDLARVLSKWAFLQFSLPPGTSPGAVLLLGRVCRLLGVQVDRDGVVRGPDGAALTHDALAVVRERAK